MTIWITLNFRDAIHEIELRLQYLVLDPNAPVAFIFVPLQPADHQEPVMMDWEAEAVPMDWE